MTVSARTGPASGTIRVLPPPRRGVVVGLVCAALAGPVVAYLVAGGHWYMALALLLVLPTFLVLHRYPLAAITVWLLLTPLVVETSNENLRRLFWLVHRGLPVATLLVVLIASITGIRRRELPKLGWPELLMAGYVVATLFSIFYASPEPGAAVILLFDRVVVPMCLYLVVRLLEPDERDLRRLMPAIIFVLLTQSLIGLTSWIAPGALPSDWLGKVGERTIGSLRTPDVFGTTLLFCGLFLFHFAMNREARPRNRVLATLVVMLTIFMVFMTFSRGNWLAGFVAVGGALALYRTFAKFFLVVMAPIVVLALATGTLSAQVQHAQDRFLSEQSEESALSRLPVVFAAVRMFEARPLVGWGYESFDRFDRAFQRQVGDLIYPEKDHASHNLYLTTLAEQGILGFLLFLGPAFYWLVRSLSARSRLPATGLISRKLVAVLWLVLAAHVIVNNFSRMIVPFGLGMFWLTLGLIASIVGRFSSTESREVDR